MPPYPRALSFENQSTAGMNREHESFARRTVWAHLGRRDRRLKTRAMSSMATVDRQRLVLVLVLRAAEVGVNGEILLQVTRM